MVRSHPVSASPDPKLQAALAAQDWPLLVTLCRQGIRKQERSLHAQRMLGFALHKLRRTEESLGAYRRAASVFPADAELLINYANVLLELARAEDAVPLLEKVCRLRPDHAMSWVKLAQCCYDTRHHEKGFAAAEKALALAKSDTERVSALNQSAIHRRELGQIQEAVRDCREAIALMPNDVSNHTNRMLFMLSDPSTTEQSMAEAAREFANIFEAPFKPHWPDFQTQRDGPWRRLRVGFLSPDFRNHSVMYFMEGVLAQLDRRQFEVWAFYLFPREDGITERVRRHADRFISLAGMDSVEQNQTIRSHNIDILIDLAGHTGHNGLMAMAQKAAPVQATWIGFPGTTGLTAIDYLITDAETDPPGVDHNYTERLLRLPSRLCVYRPMIRNVLWRYQPRYLVQTSPALSSKHVTFGSCNNLGKLTDEVLATWADIINVVPDSRLLIEGKNFDKPEFARVYRDRCARLGMDPDRLDLVPLDPANQYLTYHRIDIALDPFPLNGGTTSMDVLWMGVPLVAMEGSSFKSRLTTGILRHLGRNEWLARNRDEYIGIARNLASDVGRLNELRMTLRAEVENSILMREDRFNVILANALRDIWQIWLSEGLQPGDNQKQRALRKGWQEERPADWKLSPVPGVGLAPGHRVPLPEAHQRLIAMVETCKKACPNPKSLDGQIQNSEWRELTELSESVLTSLPNDPVALSCLAEVEFAHGHVDFAVTYLRYAQDALAAQAS